MTLVDTAARLALARAGLKASPIALVVEVTHLCNLACHYCDRHTPGPNELTREQLFTALEEFHALGMRVLSLDGGEPLTLPHIAEVVRWAKDRGLRVYMNTNGILVPRKLGVVAQLDGVKISLDGMREQHDAMRGAGSFAKAVGGAKAVRSTGVPVEFTCVIARHNVDHVDALIDFCEQESFRVVFQPARNSLFLDSERDGSSFQAATEAFRRALARIEARKRSGTAVGNAWSSLRHFRSFPEETPLPCAAGWVTATMDPQGNLFHCGQFSREAPSPNVARQGARAAFEQLHRIGCSSCWCARVVEANQLWGGRVDRLRPPRR